MAIELKQLIEAAVAARGRAYAKYSNHPVGAAILADDGNIYAGCNVENAAYPLSFCAEANAIGTMMMGQGKAIRHIVIAGPGEHVCTPCGGCRQQIREFAGKAGVPVTIVDRDGTVLLETTTAELLPHSFGPENLS
ncbi:cytidine deaminase [Kordiimonas aestuarii]|uniref:cytidine deaminase n=1 Tax=Kordiimonas aestuarii TaxID=1005925 RepID=UPI0021CEA328|nr:cytidine deaminase [Kordiimonas aestuarii]